MTVVISKNFQKKEEEKKNRKNSLQFLVSFFLLISPYNVWAVAVSALVLVAKFSNAAANVIFTRVVQLGEGGSALITEPACLSVLTNSPQIRGEKN